MRALTKMLAGVVSARLLCAACRFCRCVPAVAVLLALLLLPTFSSAEMIEGFEGSSLVGSWWGADSVAPFVYTLDFENTEQAHSGTSSMKIIYDKGNDTISPYSFLAASGLYNLSQFDYLSFWVYNDGSPLHIKVRLEDESGTPWETDWALIFPKTQTATADWENMVVDLTRGFSATTVDWSAIRNIMFMVSPGDVTNSGTFWIDDIAATRAPNEVPLEPFEVDFYGWAGGGAFATMTNTSAEFQNSGSADSLGQRSLQITWPSKAANYDNFTYAPKHDLAAPKHRIGVYTNLTLYGNTDIDVWVKSTTDNNIPILMKLTGSAGTNDLGSAEVYTGAGAWQKLTWSFSAYSNTASHVETVWIFPYPNTADNGGTMYIDNLALSGGTGPQLALAPTNFTSDAGMPDEDGSFNLSWSAVAGATNYIVEQDTDINFSAPTLLPTPGTSLAISIDPETAPDTYYYRLRAVVNSGESTRTAPLSVRVFMFPQADRRNEVIANFDSLGQVNAWWGSDGAHPWVYEQNFASTEHVHAGDYAMHVVYDKAHEVIPAGTTNAYSFFSAGGSYNFLHFDYLSFWVYNDGSPLRIKVRLEQLGDSSKAWEADWANIFPQTTTGEADWENLTIDLTRAFFGHANGDIDLSQIGQIMFMVEPGSETATGEFWLDDIELHRAVNSAPLDVFESDFFGWAAGSPFTITNHTEEFNNDGTTNGLGQRSLKVEWGPKAKNYSNLTYEPAHDTNSAPWGRVGNYPNFAQNGNNTIELFIKSATDATIPILLKFDDLDVGYRDYTGNGDWQKVQWEFAGVAGRTNVTKLYVIPYPDQADDGGVMYIDDVNLVGGAIPGIPYSPSVLESTAHDPDDDGVFDLLWNVVSNATSYEIQEDDDPDFGSPVTYSTNVNVYAFSKGIVSNRQTFYYRVRTLTALGAGSFTAPIRVQLGPPADALYEVMADFDGSGTISAWWGSDWADPWVYQQEFANTQHVHSGESAMKVVFDKANEVRTDQYGEPYTNSYSFMSASGLYDLTDFDYLSFWVYNTGSPLRIKVRFEQYGDFSKAWETDWGGIFPQTVTPAADWENICIDLTRTFYGQAAGDIDMSQIGQIMFIVEPGSETAQGEFWMDDLMLTRAPNTAPLDVFESDSYGWAAGALFSVTTTTATCHNDGSLFSLGQHSYCITWGTKSADYSNFTYEPGHDTNNAPLHRIGNYSDFTRYSNNVCEIWAKSDTETNMPILMKFDEADVGVQYYRGTGEWQRLVWDYASVAGATNVTKVSFMPYPHAADDGGDLYLDDLNLLGGEAVPVPVAPTRFRTNAKNPDGDGVYAFRWDAVPVDEYELQEDTDPNFGSPASYYTNGSPLQIAKDPVAEAGTYYYRLRSLIDTNEGSFTASLRVEVDYQPVSLLSYENLDTFDGDKQVSFWWANDPTPPFAYNLDFGSTQHVHSGVVALKVDYDKGHDVNVYSFMSAAGLFNMRNHDFLSFWVYNDGSPLKANIRLEDNAGGFFEFSWAGIEPEMKTPEADWENLVIDLSRSFGSDNIDMTSVAQIIFMIDSGDPTNSGTFWLDDVQLQRAPNSAPLEAFESDYYGWDGAGHFVRSLVSEEFHNDGTRHGLGQQSFRVTWENKPQDYSSIQYDPGHDTNDAPVGRVGNYRDFSLNSNYLLEAWFMSPTEFSMPILLKLDDADVGVQMYTGEGEWEKLTWDFSSLPGRTNVDLVFFLPYPNKADAAGIFYIDDVNLAGGSLAAYPTVPQDFYVDYPSAAGEYVVSWSGVSNTTGYQVLESTNPDLLFPSIYDTTDLGFSFSHHPTNEGGTYYYRVRAYEVLNGVTNYGSFSHSMSAYIPQISSQLGFAEEMSYDTPCAEVDNVNIPIWHTNTSSYRITVKHPEYYPVTINERGADFDDCHFTDRSIWHIGDTDGSSSEFRTSGYSDGDEYYAQDYPTAGVDEAWSEFPADFDTATMTYQDILFTAEEVGDFNLEPVIGSRLTVTMLSVVGTLELRLSIWNGTSWSNMNSEVFDSANLIQHWVTPDFFWSDAVDANKIRLEVVPAASGGQTTVGAQATYDSLELWKRDEVGEYPPTTLYDDGNIIIEAIDIDFWWRAPQGMTVVTPQLSKSDVEYFRIIKRVSDSNVVEYSQVFVLYEDGNSRLLPHPPAGVDWTPFGASVILGPTVESDRPFAGIDTVNVNPRDLSMEILYDEGGSCNVDLWVDREQHVVDVSDIQYDTTTHPFTRFRSMWAYDGKADIDRAAGPDGVFPATQDWDTLPGPWWRFTKEVPTYHNTYCPDFEVEITDPIKAFYVRQAESLDDGTDYELVMRPAARGGEAIGMAAAGGEVIFDIHFDRGYPNTHMIIRYSDDDGGNNGDYPGNLVQVFLDDVLVGETYTMTSDGWNEFDMLPSLELGHLEPGDHVFRIVTGGGTFGLNIDEFQLISHPEPLFERRSVLVEQAENYASSSNVDDAVRSNAVGGESIHMNHTESGAEATYDINLASAVTAAYMRVRYADDVAPTKTEVFVDDVRHVRFPTLHTGGWNNFTNSWELYIGDLSAGAHEVKFWSSNETYGIDLDEFEMYYRERVNRAPTLYAATSTIVGIETRAEVPAYAMDLDGDPVVVTCPLKPDGATFEESMLVWTAHMADVCTTNLARFSVDDQQGEPNSTFTQDSWLIVPLDADEDSIADSWEWTNFHSFVYTDTDDFDGDGANNFHEYISRTEPTNAGSLFRLESLTAAAAAFHIEVRTQPGRKYTLHFTDDDLSEAVTWRTFTDLSDGIGTWVETSPVASTFTFIDDFTAATSGGSPVAGGRKYRVKTE